MGAQVIDLAARRTARARGPASVSAPVVLDRPSVDDWVESYLATKTSGTAVEYRRDIQSFRSWIGEAFEVDLYDLQERHLGDWKTYQMDTEETPASSVRRYMTSTDGLYKFGQAKGWTASNPFFFVPKPKVDGNIRYSGLDLEDMRRLSDYVGRRADLRARCVVQVLLTTGLRISELCRARRETLFFREGKAWLPVVRKGGGEDAVELPCNTFATLNAYMGNQATGPLVLGERGGALTKQVGWRIVRAAGDSALPHLAGKVHPHDLRHAFVSAVLLLTGDIREAQWRAGHKDINHTMRYSHILRALESSTVDDLESLFGLVH